MTCFLEWCVTQSRHIPTLWLAMWESDTGRPSRIPVRVYARTVACDLDDTFNAAPVSSWGEILHRTGSIDLRGGKETHFKRRTIVDNATAVFTMDKASPLSARKKLTGARKA